MNPASAVGLRPMAILRSYRLEAKYECLRLLRMPMFALPCLLFPALFYLLFGVLMGARGGNAATYLLATYGVFGTMGAALFGFGATVAMERAQGMLALKRALPMPPGAWLTAKTAMAALFAAIISLELALLAAGLAGVRLAPEQWLALLGLNVAGALPFCALGLYLGGVISGNGAPAVINLIYLPMAFLSGLWLPLSMLPDTLARLAPLWPSYHLAQLALHVVGLDAGAPVVRHVAVLAAFAAVFFFLAGRRLAIAQERSMKAIPEVLAGLALAGVMAYAVAAPAGAETSPAAAPDDSFVVRGARVFDGVRDLGVQDVLVRGGRIVAVGEGAAEGLGEIDGRGHTLLPAFIDAHTHSWGEAQRDALRFGVAAELDMMGDRGRIPDERARRESLAPTDRADLWSAGAAVTAPGGHGTQFGLPVPTLAPRADAAAFVDARVAEGADYLKLVIEDMSAHGAPTRMPTLEPAQVREAIAAAHRARRMALVHVSRQQDALAAIEAGADGLAHMFVDAPADADFVEAAAATGAFVVPTLSVIATMAQAGEGAAVADDPHLAPWLTPEQASALRAFYSAPALPQALAHALDSVGALHAAGVDVLAGTDAGNPGTAHGASIHGELALLVRAGLTPAQALAAATSVPARRFGLDGRGRIAPDMRADLLLVKGDPTADIAATRAIATIWKNGRAVERKRVAAGQAAPAIAAQTLVADFDDGRVASRFGRWESTTDAIFGGRSEATQRWVAGGAEGSPGAVEIVGEVREGFPHPWAGAYFHPSDVAMAPVDASGRSELVFRARGDGRRYRVMLFSGASEQSYPAMRTFEAGPGWREVRIPLSEFAGVDLARLRGIAFVAGTPAGGFALRLDGVELR